MENNYKRIPIGQAKNLVGQKFGSLTPLYRTENRGTRTIWVCKCDCGNIKAIPAQDLVQHKTISCGCQNRKKASERMLKYNLSNQIIQPGDRFGKLVVIKNLGLRKQKSRNKNETWFLCQCDCGNTVEVQANALHNYNTISCGCIVSLGEQRIKDLLSQNNIIFKQEYTFSNLRNPKTNRPLRFDFAIFDINNLLQYLIEFDGRQHFTGPDTNNWSHSSDTLETIQYRDELKNNFCKEQGIILKRIPYTALSSLSIETITNDTFNI